ncbi:MAG: YicC family protein [Ignavibacteriae bacterium]|nr:MAG: YicC family protein [Ignavibacteriota bacterium]
MIISMTGFGKASGTVKKMSVNVELRSINSKFLEVSTRLPVMFIDKDSEIKEMIGKIITRGKINLVLTIDRNSNNNVSLQIQPDVVKDYYNLLNQIKKATNLKEEVKLEHLLRFSEIFKADDTSDMQKNWDEIKPIILKAIKDLYKMKVVEGKTLEKDITKRITGMNKTLNKVVKISDKNVKTSKERIRERLEKLINDSVQIDNNRLEYELVMLSDKLDITEEVTRAKSHLEYFSKNVKETELSGRRLNFLVQEINREINTIASKSNNSDISQSIVEMKEELEKIKEQLQNVE